jgi:membrane protein implicated in regulation of membrane protease activity
MRAGAAVVATIGGAFAAGTVARLLASQRLEGAAAWAGVMVLFATLALALVGLRAFRRRRRREARR